MTDRVGVQLAADDAASYFKTLDKINDVTRILIGTTEALVSVLGVLETEERKAGKGAKGLGDDLDKSSKQVGLFDRAVQGAGERVGHLAVDVLADAGRAVLDWAKDGVKAAGDFESGMNTFSAVVGNSLEGSGQSVEQFRDLFIQLGRELPVSTAEVQQAATEMAKGGIEPATIAAGGLRQTLQFAAASGLGLADAATIAAKVIGGWADVNATASEKAALLAHSTDLLARAANASTVNVDELALGLYNVQGTARSAGVPLDETVTTLALLAPSFNSSAEAGNAMKNMLLRLQPATDPAAEAMAELGLLTEDGNSAFYDAEGHFIGMRATADKLNKALGGLSEAQRTEALRTIFGNDALNAANTLLQQGAEGYDAMAASMAKQLGVAEQARLKQQGFNTALDNLMGSLEALQITVFSRALPALTGLINLLASGINAISDYAEATAQGETALSTISDVINTTALPALYGLTAALTAYALVQTVQAIPAILASLPAIAAQTAAFFANAAAVAAAAAPYALIGVAIAGVAFAWNDLIEKEQAATEEMLAGKQFWTDSAAAIENLGMASDETQQKLQPLADSIQMQRELLEEQIQSLARRMETGAITEAQFAAEMERLNGLGSAITFATDELNNQIDAEARAAAAGMTATTEAANLETATAELGGQASLTAQDIEDLGKKIQDTYAKGQDAVAGYATNQSTFLSQVEERAQAHKDQIAKLEAQKAKATTEEQKKGIDEQIAQVEQGYRDQEAKAAESYARQQAEQQAHLGQMLIDYTVAQAQLGNISKDKAAEIVGGLEKAYGLQESSTASTFLKMAGIVDTWSKDTSADADAYIGKLKNTQQAAADAQKAEDQYYQESAAAAATSFLDKGGDVNEYISKLEKIPLEKSTAIELPEIDDRYAEIEGIDRGLRRIPTDVRIRISVQDNVPPEYKPGSPTPFEIGIRGIHRALDDLAQSGAVLPGLSEGITRIAGGMSQLITKSDLPDDAEDLGDEIMAGWSEGMDNAFDTLLDQVKEMSEELQNEMNKAWEVSSPSGITELLGENIMLGLLGSLSDMLPELLGNVQRISGALIAEIGEIERQLQGKLDDSAREALERTRDHLQEQLDTIADVMGNLPGIIDDALSDAYGGLSDFFTTQSQNLRALFDIGRDTGELDRLLNDAQSLTTKRASIEEKLAEARKRQADIREGRLVVSDEDRAAADRQVDELTAQLEGVRHQQVVNEADQAAARKKQEDLKALQARTQQALAEAQATAAAMDDPAKAAAYLKLRSEQILREAELDRMGIEADSDEERALIANQLILERQAHEAELRAFELGQDQLSATQDLIDALGLLNDSLTLTDDMPPELAQFFVALAQIMNRLQGRAGGGTMDAMRPYLVGERGPELVIPHQASDILNSLDTRRALAPPSLGGSVSNVYGGSTVVNVDARGSNLSEAQITRAVWAGISAASSNADVRIRMGVG